MNVPNDPNERDPYEPLSGDLRAPRYFIVKGSGPFPHDMLRYDRAWAVSGIDRTDKPSYMQGPRSVVCATRQRSCPTTKRWRSFGWTCETIPKPEWLP